MGQCIFNALQTRIKNGRSATGYADNDWVTRQGLFIPKEYVGPAGGGRCGCAPVTDMNIVVSRDLDDPNWLLFEGTANRPIGAPTIHKASLSHSRPAGGKRGLNPKRESIVSAEEPDSRRF